MQGLPRDASKQAVMDFLKPHKVEKEDIRLEWKKDDQGKLYCSGQGIVQFKDEGAVGKAIKHKMNAKIGDSSIQLSKETLPTFNRLGKSNNRK